MLGKVKNWLGIEGVSIKIIDTQLDSDEPKVLTGLIMITSKSAQKIESIKITLKEKYSRGWRKSKLVDEFVIAEKTITINQEISEAEQIEVPFKIKYDLLKSEIDRLAEKNLFYKGVSKLAKLSKNTNSTYYLSIEGNIPGNRLKPFDKIEVELN